MPHARTTTLHQPKAHTYSFINTVMVGNDNVHDKAAQWPSCLIMLNCRTPQHLLHVRNELPTDPVLTSLLGLNFVGGRDIAVLQLHHNLLSVSGARTEASVLGSDVQGTRERQLQHQ